MEDHGVIEIAGQSAIASNPPHTTAYRSDEEWFDRFMSIMDRVMSSISTAVSIAELVSKVINIVPKLESRVRNMEFIAANTATKASGRPDDRPCRHPPTVEKPSAIPLRKDVDVGCQIDSDIGRNSARDGRREHSRCDYRPKPSTSTRKETISSGNKFQSITESVLMKVVVDNNRKEDNWPVFDSEDDSDHDEHDDRERSRHRHKSFQRYEVLEETNEHLRFHKYEQLDKYYVKHDSRSRRASLSTRTRDLSIHSG